MSDRDEFYVGYLDRSPPALARRTRAVVALLASVALALCLVLVASQGRFDPGRFEFGVVREFTGVLKERPHPALLVPAEPGSGREVTVWYLVGTGKHGLAGRGEGQDGRPVRVRGSVIDNGRGRMIEAHRIEPLTGREAQHLASWPATVELGRRTLAGEIVDSKCHLGAMKPGRGKPHKDCAIRCISGGIPPLLRVESRSGAIDYVVLVGADGRSLGREVLPFVAEPVEITGRVVRSGPLAVMYAEPATYRRL